MKKIKTRNIIYIIVTLYFLLCLYLNIKGAAWGVHPDGAGSLLAGLKYYTILKILLVPAIIIPCILIRLGLESYFPPDFYLMLIITIINTIIIFLILKKYSGDRSQ